MFEGLHEEILRARNLRDLVELTNVIRQAAFNQKDSIDYCFDDELTKDQIQELENEGVRAERLATKTKFKYNFKF